VEVSLWNRRRELAAKVDGHTQDIESLHAQVQQQAKKSGAGRDQVTWHNIVSRAMCRQVSSVAYDAMAFTDNLLPHMCLEDADQQGNGADVSTRRSRRAANPKAVKAPILQYFNDSRIRDTALGCCPPITKG